MSKLAPKQFSNNDTSVRADGETAENASSIPIVYPENHKETARLFRSRSIPTFYPDYQLVSTKYHRKTDGASVW